MDIENNHNGHYKTAAISLIENLIMETWLIAPESTDSLSINSSGIVRNIIFLMM